MDSVVAGTYFSAGFLGILLVFLSGGASRPAGDFVVLLISTTIGAAALLLRRGHPWITFAVLSITSLIAGVVDGAFDFIGVSLALYALAVYRSTANAWGAFGASAAVVVVAAGVQQVILSGESASSDAASAASGSFVLITLIATLVGANVGSRRRYVGALLDRAEQLARERDQQARLATAAERARITREMHDVVAHSLSIMVSLSDGADALAEKEPSRAREAIREIGEVGRRSLTEMRRLLGALSPQDEQPDAGEARAPRHPQPGVDDLPELIATFRTAGLPVATEMHGEPPTGTGVGTAIYRIVQEALTNALRYSKDPSRVLVRLDYRGGGAVVEVTDDGEDARMPPPSVGSGRGLIGMRERALLYGGAVEAGPRPGGGWRVQVTLPQARDDG